MPRLRTYECGDCARQFTFLHHPEAEPAFCPHCGSDGSSHDQVLAMPSIGTHKGAGPDQLYRAMEEGSNFRADMAQAMGVDAAEADGLRISNMRDNARPGENHAIPVNNDITRTMAQQAGQGVSGFVSGGESLYADVKTGPYPNQGARTMARVKSMHSGIAASVTRAGQMNREP